MTDSARLRLPRAVQSDVTLRQTLRYRAMSFEEKLRLADDLGRLAWELTCTGVRLRHPDFDDARVRDAALGVFRAAAD